MTQSHNVERGVAAQDGLDAVMMMVLNIFDATLKMRVNAHLPYRVHISR